VRQLPAGSFATSIGQLAGSSATPPGLAIPAATPTVTDAVGESSSQVK
jgi:hypothetical protein